MRSALRNLAIAGAVLGALAFLLVKTQVEEHDRYLHLVLRLQKADLALDEHLLEARHASLLNYDPLVEDLRDLRSGAEELAALRPTRDLPRSRANGTSPSTVSSSRTSFTTPPRARRTTLESPRFRRAERTAATTIAPP